MTNEELFSLLQQNYQINDIVPNTARFIFVLESPHMDELTYSAPVSGRSGKSMSKALFGQEKGQFALGRLAKKNFEDGMRHPILDRIGIMNVCQIPMQMSAYGAIEHIDFFDEMEKVRTGHYDGEMYRIILSRFERRLEQFRGKDVCFIPCGKFAQAYFRAVTPDPTWEVFYEIPHPSRNQWTQVKYKPVIDEMVASILQGDVRRHVQLSVDGYTPFTDEAELLSKLKMWKLVSEKKESTDNQFHYKGIYADDCECSVVGYLQGDSIIVVHLLNGMKIPIHHRYLQQMQSNHFSRWGEVAEE